MPGRRVDRHLCVIFTPAPDKVRSKQAEPVHHQSRYGATMEDSLESTSQSFIVKVWIEDSAKASDLGVWHGHITHVSSGKRQYLKNLDEIRDFIAPHLEEMGVKLKMRWSMSRWLKRLIGPVEH